MTDPELVVKSFETVTDALCECGTKDWSKVMQGSEQGYKFAIKSIPGILFQWGYDGFLRADTDSGDTQIVCRVRNSADSAYPYLAGMETFAKLMF